MSTGVSDSINNLNYGRYQNFYEQDLKQCILSFDGPAFKGLAINSLSEGICLEYDVLGGMPRSFSCCFVLFPPPDQMQYAQGHLRVLCGLYGILRPFDNIRPYRFVIKVDSLL